MREWNDPEGMKWNSPEKGQRRMKKNELSGGENLQKSINRACTYLRKSENLPWELSLSKSESE